MAPSNWMRSRLDISPVELTEARDSRKNQKPSLTPPLLKRGTQEKTKSDTPLLRHPPPPGEVGIRPESPHGPLDQLGLKSGPAQPLVFGVDVEFSRTG